MVDELSRHFYSEIIQRGRGYLSNVRTCMQIENMLYSTVQGASLYEVKFNLNTFECECTCPYSSNCKHAVATYLVYEKGGVVNADDYIEGLNKLDKAELIKIIKNLLPGNSDLVIKDVFKKKLNKVDWIEEFKLNPSLDFIELIEDKVYEFNFEQIDELLDYLDSNGDYIHESLIPNSYYDCDYYYEEEDHLAYLEIRLREALVKLIDTQEKKQLVLNKSYAKDIIFDFSDTFYDLKDQIKNTYSEFEYFNFLLTSSKTNPEEVFDLIDDYNKDDIYRLCNYNLPLAEKLAPLLKDNVLNLIVAHENEDVENILKYFDSFKKADQKYFLSPDKLVNLFMETNLEIPKKVLKPLFTKKSISSYEDSQIKYLLNEIGDNEFIVNNISFQMDFDKLKRVLNYLRHKGYDVKKVILENNLLKGRHWTVVVRLLNYIRTKYGDAVLKNFIVENQSTFARNSTLKSILKKKGILISVRKGVMEVIINEPGRY